MQLLRTTCVASFVHSPISIPSFILFIPLMKVGLYYRLGARLRTFVCTSTQRSTVHPPLTFERDSTVGEFQGGKAVGEV